MSKIILKSIDELKDVLRDVITQGLKDVNLKDELYSSFNDKYDYSSIKDFHILFFYNKGMESFDENAKKYKCFSEMTSIPPLDTKNVTSMSKMFKGCKNLKSIPMMDTSNVENMNSMFEDCYNLTTIPLLDTKNVYTMNYMFDSCTSLEKMPFLIDKNGVSHSLDTTNLTHTSQMFDGCDKLPKSEKDKILNKKSNSPKNEHRKILNSIVSDLKLDYEKSSTKTYHNPTFGM